MITEGTRATYLTNRGVVFDMTREDIFRKHRQAIRSIGRTYGVRSVKLFGSVARGQERPDSDVDFLVEMDSGRSLFDLGGFQMELEELLGCKVDVVTVKGIRKRIRARAMEEAVPL